jgi:EpsI family protein
LIVAALMIGSTLALTEALARRPEGSPEKPLVGLPSRLGDRWRGRDLPLSNRDLEMLQLSDYVNRVYSTDGAGEPVELYIGYYQNQRTGSTYHSPLNCLPGSGWQVAESGYERVPGTDLRVKKLLIEKELRRSIVLYWYYDRGRVITSEYSAKAYLIWDAITKNRTDGALVRIVVPVATRPEAAAERALAFLSELWPSLQEHLSPALVDASGRASPAAPPS